MNKNSCRLSWRPPSDDGGSKVTHYIVEKQELGKPYWTTVASYQKETDMDVQGLHENGEYLFRVAAVNENGQGQFLVAQSSVIAKLPFDKPGSPGIPSVESVGDDFVSLSWDKPRSDGGGRLKGYFIERREAGTKKWVRVTNHPILATIYNVNGLIEDKSYEFQVIAVNEAGESAPTTCSRPITVKDPAAAKLPEFLKTMKPVNAVQGKTAKFEVEIVGNPTPTVTWFKGTRELHDGDSKYEIREEGGKHILIVKDVYGEDADEYAARITNKAGSKISRADLIIESPPKIKIPPRFKDIATFDVGEDIVIKLPFVGFPKPTVAWFKDGKDELKTQRNVNIELGDRHSFLKIKHASNADSASYKLTLENRLGSDSATIRVEVNDKPDPPRFAQVENVTFDSVMLTWKAPAKDGGSVVTQYVVEKLEPPMKNWLRACVTRFTHGTVESLSSGHDYQFRIIAENLFGKSEPCEPTGIIHTPDESDSGKHKPSLGYDEYGRRVRGKYNGPKIDNYDKFFKDTWNQRRPTTVDVKLGSVYDYYDVLEELGSGAFGVVHRCVEKSTGRNYVAKFINTPHTVDKQTVRNEVNVMNNLYHRKLLHLHDAFDDEQEMVLILEFLSGGDLFDRIADDDYRMSEAEVIRYMRQLCEAICYMHEQSIVHLDIKPENVLCETQRSTDIKLIDFGLAAKLDPENAVKVSTATAEFAAPEVANHEPVGFYTDMWALGVLSYILLSGLSPFAGEDDYETLENVRQCDWHFDDDAFKTISPLAKDFINRLLLKNASQRMTIHEALEHAWLKDDHGDLNTRIPASRYKAIRDKLRARFADWPHPLPTIGRIANFSSLKKQRAKEHRIYDSQFDRKEALPRFIRKPHSTIAEEGSSAKFKCKVIAASPPLISWLFKDSVLSPSIKYMPKYSGNEYELRISRLKADEDSGTYVVRAENSYGRREESTKLTVEHSAPLMPRRRAMSVQPLAPNLTRKKLLDDSFDEYREPADRAPRFTFPLRNRHLVEGVGVKLICTVDCKPPPKIEWYKDGNLLKSSSCYEINYSLGVSSLEIGMCSTSDAGRYTCIAKNEKGSEQTECRVTVTSSSSRRQQHSLRLD